jgi:hypothetical protein
MGSRVEDLLSLAKMLDEGKVSQEEYEIVKAEIIAAPADEWLEVTQEPFAGEHEEAERGLEPARDDEGASEPLDLAATIEVWIDKAKSLPAPVLWGAVALVAVLLGLAFFGGGEPPRVQAAAVPANESPAEEITAGSLGIRVAEIAAAWNGAGIPPEIRGAFTFSPEAGPLDSFLYRFDGAAVLAGAYDPSDDAVYALMLRAGLGHGDIGDLNSHICHLLHPFSQACLDTFRDAIGVGSVEELKGSDHQASWEFEGNTWRLSTGGDVETLRVIAPDQP